MSEVIGEVYPLHVGPRDDPEAEVFDHPEPAQVVTRKVWPRLHRPRPRRVLGRLRRGWRG